MAGQQSVVASSKAYLRQSSRPRRGLQAFYYFGRNSPRGRRKGSYFPKSIGFLAKSPRQDKLPLRSSKSPH